MTRRAQGMDHGLYRYSPSPQRPRLIWPGGARVAVCVYLYFEYLELEPPEGTVRDPRFHWRPIPDVRQHSWHEYGVRVGIFRILELLDRFNLKVTVAANAEACDRYPYLIDAFCSRSYELAAHGSTASRMITSKMTEAEERGVIKDALTRITRATGRRPRGWIGQDYSESTRTPSLIAEAGLKYVADWPNDDQPYLMTVGDNFISIPNQAQWDDVQLLWDRRMQPPRYPEIVEAAFNQLYAEGEVSGKFFSLGLHPWLIGAPHRIRYLEEALNRFAGRSSVWLCTAEEVASHMRASVG